MLPASLRIANNPIKVRLRFSDPSSLSLSFAVNSFKPFVIATNCSAVAGGNISRNASLIGLIILMRPSNMFLKESIRSCRPPITFQFSRSSLRASADLPIKPPTTSEICVKSSFASSKSPIRISQVWVHPDCAASLSVSNN